MQQWLNEIKQKTEPAIIPEVQLFSDKESTLVLLSISEYPVKPIAMQGRYYKRVQNSNHSLSADEIADMRLKCLNMSLDAIPVSLEWDDLIQSATQLFIEKVKGRGRYISSNDLMTDFYKLGFYDGERFTRAAELLFATHRTNIHIGRFKSQSTIIDDIVIREPLVMAVEEAMLFIKKNIAIEYEFTGELQRTEHWQFPLQAIRELLLNAIVHRDYRESTDLIIKIYDDRIDFSNPGGLVSHLSPEILRQGNYQPYHRNKLLAEAFYLMGEIEKYGTGFARINEWLDNNQNLEVDIKENG